MYWLALRSFERKSSQRVVIRHAWGLASPGGSLSTDVLVLAVFMTDGSNLSVELSSSSRN